MEESHSQIFEIIPIARNEASRSSRGAVQVRFIRKRGGIFFVRANRVESLFSEDFRDCRTQIGVEVVLHWVVS